jgi:hypothetical protein
LPAMGGVIYDSIPSPQPGNVPSVGYQATQTAEFGNLIDFAGTYRDLTSVTVLMSDWALASTYGSSSATWDQALTFNLYSVDNSGEPGSVIATRTQTFAIPWRPASAGCADPTAWLAADGGCYHGLAFTVTFDFTGVTVPDQIIYGLAFNTNTWGYTPTNAAGPYESLNFGLAEVPPSVGSNPVPGTAYAATGSSPTFQSQSGWANESGAVSFATPEPITSLLLGTGLLVMGLIGRRRRSKNR